MDTVNCQLSVLEPPELDARIVIVYGLPLDTGLDQDTTPVLEFMLIPTGPLSKLHVTNEPP